ncbi:hypothetical protein like AT4G18220 [Hibiscus trionum]|uniref:Probable purine permease n=1 Tax=Hibiscus trionum TaxID=183268 RepID=A0A9W7HQI6_HIBTR|nr:hypothetical protein like AT4G18220 [Hibiscus trionum]
MAEAQQLQVLHIQDAKTSNSRMEAVSESSDFRPHHQNNTMKWLRIALYIVVGFSGTASASLLMRLYYEKGGTSKWMGTLVQVVGFPILLPYYLIPHRKAMAPNSAAAVQAPPAPSIRSLVCAYVYLGLLMVGNGYLYSVGFEYLPVSTVALISASQLAFNAFFSYFLNAQKFTPLIVNSLFLLTISSVLLVTNSSSERPAGVSGQNYVVGMVCTLIATAINGLFIASQQMVFQKVLKRQTVRVAIDLVIYQSLVASIVASIGFLASGEWKGLKREMEGYALGKTSYVNTLVWTAVGWQVSILCVIAIVFESSALFANVVGALGVPIAPLAAMIVFHDKMNGIKGISMALAVWGFLSYVYQQYLDEQKSNAETKNGRPFDA